MDDDDGDTAPPLPETYSEKLTGAIMACIQYEDIRRPDIMTLLRRIRWHVNGVTPTETPTVLEPPFSPPHQSHGRRPPSARHASSNSSSKPSTGPVVTPYSLPPDPPPLSSSQARYGASNAAEPVVLARQLSEVDIGSAPDRKLYKFPSVAKPASDARLSDSPDDDGNSATKEVLVGLRSTAATVKRYDDSQIYARERYRDQGKAKEEKSLYSSLDNFRRKEKDTEEPIRSKDMASDLVPGSHSSRKLSVLAPNHYKDEESKHTGGIIYMAPTKPLEERKTTKGKQPVSAQTHAHRKLGSSTDNQSPSPRSSLDSQIAHAAQPPSIPKPHTPKLSLTINTLIGTKINIRIQPSATVFDLKQAISAREGIAPDEQRLIALSTQLEDNYQLSEYGITSDTPIHLVLRLRGTDPSPNDGWFTVYVKTLSNETFPVTTRNSDTIFKIKGYLANKNGTEIDKQRLIFAGTQLEDPRTVHSYAIWPGATLHLVYRVGDYEIYVKTLTGQTIRVRCSPTDTVSKIKDEVYVQAKIEQGKQRLIFVGKQLVDSATLQSSGITDQSTIHLVMRM